MLFSFRRISRRKACRGAFRPVRFPIDEAQAAFRHELSTNGDSEGHSTANNRFQTDRIQSCIFRSGLHTQQGFDLTVELGHQKQSGQQAEQNAGEQQIIHKCEAFGGENAFGQTCHRLKVFNGKLHLEDIHDRAQQQLNGSTAKRRDANLEFGDQFGEKSCKAVQGHGQHEHHQLLGLISGLLVDC